MSYGPFELQSYPCAICGSLESKPIMSKRGLAVPEEFTIVECAGCGHHFVNPRIADASLGDLYNDAYFRAGGFDATANYFAAPSAFTLRVTGDVVGTVADALERPLAGSRWLDFGCGPGHLLEALLARGVDAVGFDDSEAALSICKTRNLPVIAQEDFDDYYGQCDVISAIEVIEHVADPRDFLRFLVRFLRVGGVAYVQTGNWNMVKRVAGTPYVMPEGHIRYFTPPEMRRLFAECGLVETGTLNRSWFAYRDLPDALRNKIPKTFVKQFGVLARNVLPGYAPFPVGRRADV